MVSAATACEHERGEQRHRANRARTGRPRSIARCGHRAPMHRNQGDQLAYEPSKSTMRMSTRPAVAAFALATLARIRFVAVTHSRARRAPLCPANRTCRGLAAVCSVALLALVGCGSNQHSSSTSAGRGQSKAASGQHTSTAPAPPARLVYRHLFSLPAPLRDPASALISGGRFVFLGGLDAADSSTAGIELSNVHQDFADVQPAARAARCPGSGARRARVRVWRRLVLRARPHHQLRPSHRRGHHDRAAAARPVRRRRCRAWCNGLHRRGLRRNELADHNPRLAARIAGARRRTPAGRAALLRQSALSTGGCS